jgi:hypothetical protein
MFRRLLWASLLAWLASCNNSGPTSPGGPSPPGSPSLPAPQSYVVSGTVSETVGGISRPSGSRKIDLYISGSTCISGQPIPCITEQAPVVETDQNGRYTAQATVLAKTLVFVAGAGLHATGQQPCLASALVDKDTTIDVEVFPAGRSSTPPPAAGPMITGFVYETTSQGRNPLRGVWAWLEVGFADSFPVARTQTDDAGRFFFCRVNAPVRMGVGISGYQEWPLQSIPGTGDMSFEIELKR